jgi:hypothetical protein
MSRGSDEYKISEQQLTNVLKRYRVVTAVSTYSHCFKTLQRGRLLLKFGYVRTKSREYCQRMFMFVNKPMGSRTQLAEVLRTGIMKTTRAGGNKFFLAESNPDDWDRCGVGGVRSPRQTIQ